MQRKAPSPGSRSTSADSEAQAVATDPGIVSQADPSPESLLLSGAL